MLSIIDHCACHGRALSTIMPVYKKFQSCVIQKAYCISCSENIPLPMSRIWRHRHKHLYFRIEGFACIGAFAHPVNYSSAPDPVCAVGRIYVYFWIIPFFTKAVMFWQHELYVCIYYRVLVGAWIHADLPAEYLAHCIYIDFWRSPVFL